MGGKGSGIQTNVHAPRRDSISNNIKPQKKHRRPDKKLAAFQKANLDALEDAKSS